MSIASQIERLYRAKANIKTAIENKGVSVGNGTIDTYAQKIDGITVSGSSGILPLSNAKLIQFSSLNGFGQNQVSLNLGGCASLANFCAVSAAENRNTTVNHLTINGSTPTAMNAFLQCSYAQRDLTLNHLTLNIDTSQATTWLNAFNCQVTITTIDGNPLDLSSATNTTNIFNYCSSLQEIRFVQNSIPISLKIDYASQLSNDSINSIIDGLADLTGKTTQTLTLEATVGAKLTDAQKAIITAKNWTLVY